MKWLSFSGGSMVLLVVLFLLSYYDKWSNLGWFGEFMLFVAGIGAIFSDIKAQAGDSK